jgi:hypothetical protein
MARAGKSGARGAPPVTPTALAAAPVPSAAAALAAARPAAAQLAPSFAAAADAVSARESLAFPGAPLMPASAQADIDRQRGYQHLLGLQRHYEHKSKWSYFLMAMMAGMLGFQSLLLGLVGAGTWTFLGYDWLLPALLVQNLAQIAGLCVIVVQSLFKDIG